MKLINISITSPRGNISIDLRQYCARDLRPVLVCETESSLYRLLTQCLGIHSSHKAGQLGRGGGNQRARVCDTDRGVRLGKKTG